MTRLGDFLTLGNFLRPLATINLPKPSTFLGNFCKGVQIVHFSCEIIFGQLLQTFGYFCLVTLTLSLNWEEVIIILLEFHKRLRYSESEVSMTVIMRPPPRLDLKPFRWNHHFLLAQSGCGTVCREVASGTRKPYFYLS